MHRAILLHAFAADRLTWAGTTPALSGVETLTPDLPGHGTQLSDLGDGTLDDLAARLWSRIEGHTPAFLIGHSLGGGLAIRLAARHPDRVTGLALLAPLGLAEGVRFADLDAYADIETEPAMESFLKSLVANPGLIVPAFAAYALGQLNAPGARDAMHRIAGHLETGAAGLAADIETVARTDLPVTTIWGALDPVARPDRSRIDRLGDFTELPDTGHIPHVEAMASVNVLLSQAIAAGRDPIHRK